MKWFRIHTKTGRVAGVTEANHEDIAKANLGPGEHLMAFDPKVNPRTDVLVKGKWVRRNTPGREADWAFMRRSGYDLGAQVGALMKLVEAIVSISDIRALIPEEILEEFEAQVAWNKELKQNHPKVL